MTDEDKKFTQADVDRFIGERLQREKTNHISKEDHDKELSVLKTTIDQLTGENVALEAKITTRDNADLKVKIAGEEKLPVALIPLINGTTDGEIRAAMKILVSGIGVGPAIGTDTNPANTGIVRFTKAQVEAMKPDEVTKNWKIIESQLADGSLNH